MKLKKQDLIKLKEKKRITKTISITLNLETLQRWKNFNKSGFDNRSAFLDFAMNYLMDDILEMEKSVKKSESKNKKKFKIKPKEVY